MRAQGPCMAPEGEAEQEALEGEARPVGRSVPTSPRQWRQRSCTALSLQVGGRVGVGVGVGVGVSVLVNPCNLSHMLLPC